MTSNERFATAIPLGGVVTGSRLCLFQSLLQIVETEFGAGDNLVVEIVLVRHADIVQRSSPEILQHGLTL